MFKAISRAAQKKQNYMITAALAKIGCSSLSNDIELCVVWKRGPESQKSQVYELNEIEHDTDMTDIFTKVSSFYSKDNITFEKKMCNFGIMMVDNQGVQTQIGDVEVDMSDYVNHNDSHQHIEFKCDSLSGLFLDVVWSITESTDKKNINRNSLSS